MSTERASRRTERRATRFRRSAAIVIGGLLAGSSTLAAVGLLQGPRLDDAAIDSTVAIERGGARLVLDLDQPIAVDPRVAIAPAVAVAVEAAGNRIVVTFEQPLAAETEYLVTADVVGAGSGRGSQVVHRFTTPRYEVATLVREPDGDDRVILRELRSEDPQVLASAPTIQEFALLDDAVAYVALDERHRADLRIAPFGESVDFAVGLPEPGTVTRLDAAAGLVAFAFSSAIVPGSEPRHTNALHIYDTTDPNAAPRMITGLDGTPLQIIDARFVPGTTSLVVHAFDSSLYLVDGLGGAAPAPLGQHTELRGFLPGTAATLVLADPDSGSLMDLTTGETSRLDLPDGDVPPEAYRTHLATTSPSSYVEVVSQPRSPDEQYRFDFSVVAVDETGTRTIFEPPSDGAAIEDVCVSPNRQYVAVAVAPPERVLDGVPNAPSTVGVATFVIAIADGRTAGVVPGFAIDWCG